MATAPKLMNLQKKSSIDCPPPMPRPSGTASDWTELDRCNHSPMKIATINGNRTVCMASPTTMTFQTLESGGTGTAEILFQPSGQKPALMAKPMSFIQAGILYNVVVGIKRYIKIPVVISGHTSGDLCIWNADTSQYMISLKSHSRAISGIEIQSDFKKTLIISTSHDHTAKIWDSEDNGFNMSQTINLDHPVLCLAVSFNRKIVAFGAEARKLVVYSKERNGKLLAPHKKLSGHLHNITCLKFWPDGSLLLSGSVDSKLILWDPYTGECKQIFTLYHPLPKYIFNMQVLNFDINPYGTAIVCLYDTPRWRKSENCQDTASISLWDPLKDKEDLTLMTNEEQSVMNTKPESTVFLVRESMCRTCEFMGETNIIGVPSFTDSQVQLIQANLNVPTLRHFCRLTIRKIVSEPQEVLSLPLPHVLLSFLSYRTM